MYFEFGNNAIFFIIHQIQLLFLKEYLFKDI